jgi:histidinol-phosphatase (PHP family)
MLENNKPDIVGHLDKIKMHNTVNAYFREDDVWYVDAVEETLDLIASRGSILEVNTRGLYKHTPPLLYPSSWILKRAFQKKIPVMINSDSHHPDEIDSGFTEVSELLADIGYRTLKVLIHGSWQDKPFTSKGLLF